MSHRFLILRESLSGNHIPSGRQLHRTPPFATVTKHLDFNDEDSNHEQNMKVDTKDQDVNYQNVTFDFNTTGTNSENISDDPDDPMSMLKGMKGYQVTPSDLEFIKMMKEEKLIKKLQGDVEEVQRLLKQEMMSFELLCACRKNAQADLNMLPSCEDVTEWVKVVPEMTSSSSTEFRYAKSLLAMVTQENIQRAMDEKRIENARLEKMVANKRKKEAKEKGQLEKQIANEQLKIQRLMSQLSDLKSELAQQEEAYKALELQLNPQEAPEIKTEEVDPAEELQAAKTQEISRGKRRTKAVKSTEKLQDRTNQSKSTRSRNTDGKTDNQISVKDDHASKNPGETVKTKQKSSAAGEKLPKVVREVREPKKNVEEANSQVRDAKERRKLPTAARTTASQPKNQSHVKIRKAQSSSQLMVPSQGRKKAAVAAGDAGEEPLNTGLRRSKRIASRK